jgi:hypothetical protein
LPSSSESAKVAPHLSAVTEAKRTDLETRFGDRAQVAWDADLRARPTQVVKLFNIDRQLPKKLWKDEHRDARRVVPTIRQRLTAIRHTDEPFAVFLSMSLAVSSRAEGPPTP